MNTAADSENKIHDDLVAAIYGFRGGLVPGVTVYGYMTVPVLEHFGEEWLERGAMSVRFKEPLYEGEDVAIASSVQESGRLIVSVENGRSVALAWMERDRMAPRVEDYAACEMTAHERRPGASPETLVAGAVLGTLMTSLDLAHARMSAPLPAYVGEARLAHPAILLALANEILVRNFVLGPWIHAASEVTNFSAARDGEVLELRGKVEEAYERKGHQFVVLKILTLSGTRVIQGVRHTAIWKPRCGA